MASGTGAAGRTRSKAVGYFYAFAGSFWPLLIPVGFISVLIYCDGSGTWFDIAAWPGTANGHCDLHKDACLTAAMLRRIVKIIIFPCASLLLVNGIGYMEEVRRAAEAGKGHAIPRVKTMRRWAHRSAMLATFLNLFWLFLIVFVPARQFSFRDQLMVIVLFVVFMIVDIMLAVSHAADVSPEGRHEYDFFWGNACFIDIPILLGVTAVAIFMSTLLGAAHGKIGNDVVDVASTGASLMHLVISQIIYCFLTLQLKLKRGIK